MAQAVAEFQQFLTGLANQLGITIAQLGARLSNLNQRELLAFITDAYPELVTPYLAAAADATAVWYDEQPTSAVKLFIAQPADLIPVGQLAISARWAMLQGSPVTALQGTATRSVFTTSRETVITNADRENVRWARHASANACGFCRMLATRGAVYRSQVNAQKSHDHCHCLAVPDRDGLYKPPSYVAQWEKDYVQARKDGASTPAEIANALDKAATGRRASTAGAAPPMKPEAAPGGPGGPRGPSGSRSVGAGGDDDRVRLNDETKEWTRRLSDPQRAAVARWQGTDRFYQRVQNALVGATADAEAAEVADTLLEVVTHPLAQTYTVWRGARSSISTFGVSSNRLEELPGTPVPAGRFVATSLSQDVAVEEFTKPELAGGAVLMELTLKPGVRVGWLPPVGRAELARQQEVLLHPDMQQRILGVDRSGPVPVVRIEVSSE